MKRSSYNKLGFCKLIIVLLCMLSVGTVVAVKPVEVKSEYEKRYHELLNELRCLVCQNQTIAESNSELANDLRVEVNKMLNEGASNNDIVAFMADRYGDFVLYKPLVKPKTYFLWFGPFVFLVIILLLVLMFLRKQRPSKDVDLSTSEKQKLDSILKDTKE